MSTWHTVSKRAIRGHLKSHWKKRGGCAVCGSNNWEILEQSFLLPEQKDEAPLPVSVVFCAKCGNMHLFSSEIIRYSRRSKEEK